MSKDNGQKKKWQSNFSLFLFSKGCPTTGTSQVYTSPTGRSSIELSDLPQSQGMFLSWKQVEEYVLTFNQIHSSSVARYTRSTSVPPSSRFSSCHAATPFRDRATSVPPARERLHYTDFDYKVIDYMGRLSREDAVKTTVSQARTNRNSNNFSYRYNFYDSEKHNNDYLYPSSKDIFGRWKHFSLSNQTLNERNDRAASPLVSRELNRQDDN